MQGNELTLSFNIHLYRLDIMLHDEVAWIIWLEPYSPILQQLEYDLLISVCEDSKYSKSTLTVIIQFTFK